MFSQQNSSTKKKLKIRGKPSILSEIPHPLESTTGPTNSSSAKDFSKKSDLGTTAFEEIINAARWV
jgi:hypothetical protein